MLSAGLRTLMSYHAEVSGQEVCKRHFPHDSADVFSQLPGFLVGFNGQHYTISPLSIFPIRRYIWVLKSELPSNGRINRL